MQFLLSWSQIFIFFSFATVSQASGFGWFWCWPSGLDWWQFKLVELDFLLLLTTNICFRYNLLRRKFPATSFTGSPVLSDAGFDLLNRLLTYDPDKVFSYYIICIYIPEDWMSILSWMWKPCSESLLKKLLITIGSVKFLFRSRRSLCLHFLLTVHKTGICLIMDFLHAWILDFSHFFSLFKCDFRRTRRVMKSPDPLEEQRRKELQQGEISNGGLFSQ